MIFNELKTLDIKYRFKMFTFLVCGIDSKLYQLTHFKRKRTCYFKEIKYNKVRKGYRINSLWVSVKRLHKLKYNSIESVIVLKKNA